MFIAKYDSAGSVLWARSEGGQNYDRAFTVTADDSGNAIVAGIFESASVTFGSFVLTNTGGTDAFIAKYDSSGTVVWGKSIGGSSNEWPGDLSADDSGNIYVAGYFQSPSIAFGATVLTNASAVFDLYVAKLSNSGASSVEESYNGFEIKAIPNPFTAEVVIHAGSYLHNASLHLCNSSGQQVVEMNNISGESIRLKSESLKSGMYFLQIIEDNGLVATKKLVVAD